MKRLSYLLTAALFILLLSCSGNSGKYDRRKSPVRADNISNQFVYAFAEDTTGQIWIGTFRGLNRFNSRDYFQYYSLEDSSSLTDNQIRTLFTSRGGDLYIGTVQGLNRRNKKDNFTTIDLGGRYLVEGIAELADSTLIISASGQLFSYSPSKDTVTPLMPELFSNSQYTVKIHVDADDHLWIIGDSVIRLYNRSRNTLTDSIPIGQFCPRSFLTDGHELWLTGESLKIFDTRARKFVDIPEPIKKHKVLSHASYELVHPYGDEGIFLLTSSDGMFYYDRVNDTVTSQYDSGFPFSIPDFKIKTMFTDSRRNIWFGAHDQGIHVHFHYTERFNHNKFIRSALENKSVVSLAADKDNNLWMATRNDGIFIHDNKAKTVRQIPISELSLGNFRYDELVKTVFVDSKGSIWFILTNAEVIRCHYDGHKLNVDNRYSLWGGMSMMEDSNGTIWVSTASPYLFYMRPGDRDFTPLQVFEPGYIFVPGLKQFDKDHIVAAAFMQPMRLVDINSLEVSNLPVADSSFSKVMRRSVFIPTDLCPDGKGNLWIGTIANGLLRYNMADSVFTSVEGIASSDISSIRIANDDLWISTLNGMSHFKPSDGSSTNYFGSDGTGGDQFYDRASAVDSAGNIYFGGTHGVTSFMPSEVDTLVSAPLIFQNLMIHNKAIAPGTGVIDYAMEYSPEINLDHDHNSFGITFVAIDYCSNPRVSYRYMLEGIDDGWIEASDSREAYYANVPPGSYRFRVGIVGDTEGEIAVIVKIHGPWWTSWWAILFYILAVAAVACIIVMAIKRIRKEKEAVKRARLEKEREQHINDMNMRFFANISHEFRTPLTMISGPINQLAEIDNLKDSERHLLSIARTNVNRMVRLVNQLLDFNKIENDTLPLEVERIDIAALLRQISDSFAVHAVGKEITFTTSGCQDNCFVTADADKISKITTNLLSNAFKFTPRGGSVSIGLDTVYDSEMGECVKIFVRNTGNRIPTDQLEKIFERYYQLSSNRTGEYNCGSGIGLYYARALATIHHGKLFASDKQDLAGAEFILLIPTAIEVYASDRHKENPTQLDAFPISSTPGSVSPVGAEVSDVTDRPLILVVEDDVQVAEYLRTLLSVSYRVISRFDAESALEWLDENIPSLIISDVVMPGKDGYELCRMIKHDIRFSHIPVILLTAKATVESQVEGLDAEADAYMTKPFDPSILMSQIGSLLRNREKARQMITTATTIDTQEAEILSECDSEFLKELYTLMETELANCELDVNEMSRQMRMSRTKFYYKVKGLTGETPSGFFKTYKLNRAVELIREHKYNLSEISYMTGFSSLSHFSRSFKKQFGVAPTSFKDNAEN